MLRPLHAFPTRRSSDLSIVALAIRLAGPDRILLITDGTDVAGQPDGEYKRWEGTEVVLENGQAFTHSGSLAGSTIRDRKSTRLNSSNLVISYAVFCVKE